MKDDSKPETMTNGEEIYGGYPGAIERAEKQMSNRRTFIKQAMKPAEKARDGLIDATATDAARKQGGKDNRIPRIAPYVEKAYAVDKAELAKLIHEADSQGCKWRVGKSLKEGYRYLLYIRRNAPSVRMGESKNTLPKKRSETLKESLKAGDGIVVIHTSRDAYSQVEAAEGSITVGEFIEELRRYDRDDKVIFGLDGGYTYGAVKPANLRTHRVTKGDMEDAGLLDEASTAEKRSFRQGGKATDDLARGRAIASIKDKKVRDAAVAAVKAGREDVADNEYIGDRKNLHIENDLDRKAMKMQKAGMREAIDEGDEHGPIKKRDIPNEAEIDDIEIVSEKDSAIEIEAPEGEIEADAIKSPADDNPQGEAEDLNAAPIGDDVEVSLDDLRNFKPYAGATATYDTIIANGKLQELADALSDFAEDGKMTATDLNDMLWFESDWVLGKLGIDGDSGEGEDDGGQNDGDEADELPEEEPETEKEEGDEE